MKRVRKFFGEFRTFIAKGNILDLAVAVIIGGAFGKIVTSLVNDIITPLIGLALGRGNIADKKIVFQEATETTVEAAIRYGLFIQSIIDFLIIALTIFLALRIIMRSKEGFNKSKAIFIKKQAKLIKKLKKKGASVEEIEKAEKTLEEIKALPDTPVSNAPVSDAPVSNAPVSDASNEPITANEQAPKTVAERADINSTEPAPKNADSKTEELLSEIRDLLKQKV